MEEEVVEKASDKKKPGRPPKMKLTPREPEQVTRQIKAEPEVEETRQPREGRNGRIEVVGRNGEVLSRSSTYVQDSFEIPRNQWPKGYDLQWNTISVHGNADIVRDLTNLMASQGWRPVPAERYAGTLLPRNAKGMIVRGGLILEERPTVLGEEARAEERAAAKKLISDRNESLKLAGVKNAMPSGFEMGGKYKGTGGDIRISVDQQLDAPQPSYTLAKPGE